MEQQQRPLPVGRSLGTAVILLMLVASVILGVLGLAGCSSSASTASTPAAASVARQLGCSGIHAVGKGELYVYDEVKCTLNGHPVDVITFRTDTLRDNWIRIAEQFDGITAKGHLYAVADAPA